jgi:predicted nucleic acid-binding protein
MRRRILFDSNVLILLSKGRIDKERFADAFSRDTWLVSVITRMEVLSKRSLAPDESRFLTAFLSKCKVIGLSRGIIAETLAFRSQLGRKLPDSIIAATAILSKATLISNDSHLLQAKYPALVVEPCCST